MTLGHVQSGLIPVVRGVQKSRLVSSNADIRLQAALAGLGVLRVTASFTDAAVEAGLLRRILTDHVCEPLNIHALLPARQFVPAKVRCFLDALDAHGRGGGKSLTFEVNP